MIQKQLKKPSKLIYDRNESSINKLNENIPINEIFNLHIDPNIIKLKEQAKIKEEELK